MDFLHLTPSYKQEGCTLPSHPDDGSNGELLSAWIGYYALGATVVFTLAVFWLELILDLRQRTCYRKTDFPQQLETVVSTIDANIEKENEEIRKKKKKKEEEKKNGGGGDDDPKDDDTSKKETEGEGTTEAVLKEKELFLPQLQSKFEKSQAYGLDKVTFSIVSSVYDVTEGIAFLLWGFLPYIWDVATKVGREGKLPLVGVVDGEIGISLIFLGIIQIIGMITSLPFELYSTFHIEKKHGFNKQTLTLFFTDKIKGLILTILIGGPFTSLLLYIIQKGGQYFYLYVWGFLSCFSLFMMTIVPVLIMPLFNKYEPLKDGPLKDEIYVLAGKLNYPLKKLFVMDGSKRSAHSNAFMFGFGKNKRIVLFDTLLEQVLPDEILAILGHELGHWKLGHTKTNFIVTQVYFGVAFYSFSKCYGSQDLYSAFGFVGTTTPIIIALLLFFQTLWAPVDKLLSFCLTVFSRHCEFAADKFSVDLDMSEGLQLGLCKIHLENLGAMCPDSWYSTYHYSHPPLVERLSAMMELEKKKK